MLTAPMSIETRAAVPRDAQPGRPRGAATFVPDRNRGRRAKATQLPLFPAGSLPRSYWRSGQLQEPQRDALVTALFNRTKA